MGLGLEDCRVGAGEGEADGGEGCGRGGTAPPFLPAGAWGLLETREGGPLGGSPCRSWRRTWMGVLWPASGMGSEEEVRQDSVERRTPWK